MNTGMPLKETDFISIGIPLVTDVSHEDFKALSGVKRVSQDESPVDFDEIIHFIKNLDRSKACKELLTYAQGKGSWDQAFGPVADLAVPKKNGTSTIWKVAR
jgi:hypothetical protein